MGRQSYVNQPFSFHPSHQLLIVLMHLVAMGTSPPTGDFGGSMEITNTHEKSANLASKGMAC
jgi:hypothetical protein